jgi:outer membrane protein assembly factor BamD (BamD/ComL family)
MLLLVACAGGRTPPDAVAPPDDTERLVRLAEARAQAGAHAKAVPLFEEVMRNPSSAFTDRALLGLTRSLCNPEYAGRDYLQAFLAADRLVREYPDSPLADEAVAWRDLLVAYLVRGQELDQRASQLEQLARDLERYGQELERLRRVDLELEGRTQELERLKRLDLELEQLRRKP